MRNRGKKLKRKKNCPKTEFLSQIWGKSGKIYATIKKTKNENGAKNKQKIKEKD